AVPGIAFLSGGQSDADATAHLNAMNSMGLDLPWTLTFSYGRALQHAAMTTWGGEQAKAEAASKIGLHRAKVNGAAAQGKYTPEMDKEAA
ncbi:MAG: class I fructose-bisphosphate aldolase, partial [Gammaproteobacteria bacterium]